MSDYRDTLLSTVNALVDSMNGPDHYNPSSAADDSLSGDKVMVISNAIELIMRNIKDEEVGVKKVLNNREIVLVASMNYLRLKKANHTYPEIVAWLRAFIASRSFRTIEAEEARGDEIFTPGVHYHEIERDIEPNELRFGKKDVNVNAPPAPSTPGSTSTTATTTSTTSVTEVSSLADVLASKTKKITGYTASLEPLMAFLTPARKEEIIKMAALLPVFAAIQFQKTNHHYISNDTYKEAYFRHFRSAQLENLAATYNKAEIIYDAVHWMGPYNMNRWMENCNEKNYLPRGIALKTTPYPAGTAIVATQLAVWNAIEVYPGGQELIKIYADHLESLKRLMSMIKTDRLAYHVYSNLYDKECLLDEEDTKRGMNAAAQLAAVAQAFIETVAAGSDLSNARALKKRAEQNIGLYKLAVEAFKGSITRVRREARFKSISETLVPTITKAENQIAVRPSLPAPVVQYEE